MYTDKILSLKNINSFNFKKTKRNIEKYFEYLEILNWELARLNAGKGLTANYDFSIEYKNQLHIPIDIFNLSEKEDKEEQLKKFISSYHWAKSFLSEPEQLYIEECFFYGKCQDELLDLLGLDGQDNHEFRRIRRSAIYKFADILNLVVKK